MNAEQRQMAADPWTKPTDLSQGMKLHPPSPSLLLSPKADTHFTIPQRVEG